MPARLRGHCASLSAPKGCVCAIQLLLTSASLGHQYWIVKELLRGLFYGFSCCKARVLGKSRIIHVVLSRNWSCLLSLTTSGSLGPTLPCLFVPILRFYFMVNGFDLYCHLRLGTAYLQFHLSGPSSFSLHDSLASCLSGFSWFHFTSWQQHVASTSFWS